MGLSCSALRIAALLTIIFVSNSSIGWAQEPATQQTGKTERREKLQKQLKSILDELDQLKQEDEPRPAEPKPFETEPATAEEPAIEKGPAPEIALEDMSIISRRLLQRPEGVTLTSTVPTEYQNQPTRTMRDS